jgi:hypothetical protein
MIAHQETNAPFASGKSHQPFDNASRIGSAIDKVPKEDQFTIDGPALSIILIDHVQQPVEQISPSVYVSDRIDAPTSRDRACPRLLLARDEIEQGFDGHILSAVRGLGAARSDRRTTAQLQSRSTRRRALDPATRPDYLACHARSGWDFLLNEEWMLAAAICAAPFLIFGAIELLARLRRRRLEAVAKRPKAVSRDRSGGAFGRAD